MMIITEAVCCKTYTFGVFEMPQVEFAFESERPNANLATKRFRITIHQIGIKFVK